MPSRIKYIRDREPGEGLSLRAPSLFISEACGRVEEQQSACKWAPAEGREARLVPSGHD